MHDFPIRETQLTNGPLVVTHAMPESQSVALGIFINTGSRDETAAEAGISHALEHMLFKGTRHHDVHALSELLDGLGGNANAFTARERTCFHIRVLHEDWPEALALLSEMVLHSTVPEEEWGREKEVIFSEMAMVEDAPDEWVMDEHIRALYPGQSLGVPTIGTRDVLEAMGRGDLMEYHRRHYHASRLIVAAAGRIEHDALLEALSAIDWPQTGEAVARPAAEMTGGIQMLPRAGEQAHLVMSYPGMAAASADRPVAWLANQMLGGGMSSRLFREVREKLGLAYSVASCLSSVSDTGTWTIGCSTDPARLVECAKVVRRTL
ncbi:MAG TPA: pitrilysin family protein, partial [Mariprofundaceae bacterium]|nr:pitrilysin family protein [Mariprofundaceae bacterium]